MNGKYRVNCISVSGRKNKKYLSGDTVTAENFSSDQLGSHIALGKLIQITDEVITDEVIETVTAENFSSDQQDQEKEEEEPTTELLFAFLKDGELVNVFKEKDITKPELIDFLSEVLKIEFNSADKKSVLFQLVLDNLPK